MLCKCEIVLSNSGGQSVRISKTEGEFWSAAVDAPSPALFDLARLYLRRAGEKIDKLEAQEKTAALAFERNAAKFRAAYRPDLDFPDDRWGGTTEEIRQHWRDLVAMILSDGAPGTLEHASQA